MPGRFHVMIQGIFVRLWSSKAQPAVEKSVDLRVVHDEQGVIRIGTLNDHGAKNHEVDLGMQRGEITACAVDAVFREMSELVTLVGITSRTVVIAVSYTHLTLPTILLV